MKIYTLNVYSNTQLKRIKIKGNQIISSLNRAAKLNLNAFVVQYVDGVASKLYEVKFGRVKSEILDKKN